MFLDVVGIIYSSILSVFILTSHNKYNIKVSQFQNVQFRSLRLSACPVKSFLYLTGVRDQVEDHGL